MTLLGDSVVDPEGAHALDKPSPISATVLWRNVVLLSATWCLAVSALFIQVSVTTKASLDLASNSIATLGIGVFTITSAATVIPAVYIMHPKRAGRRNGFILAVVLGFFGAALDILGTRFGQVALLILGAMPQGLGWAFALNYRYAATSFVPLRCVGECENIDREKVIPRVLAVSVLGGALAAIVGPETTRHARDLIPAYDFMGSYVVLAVIYIVHAVLLLFIDFHLIDAHASSDDSGNDEERPAWIAEVFGMLKTNQSLQSGFISVAGGFAIMVGLMNVTPLAENEANLSFDITTWTIEAHLLGMYLPSLFSGQVVQRIGKFASMMFGFAVIFCAAIVLIISDSSVPLFIIGVTLVGIGWNFTFVAGSTLVFEAGHDATAKRRVQSVSDTFVASFSAVTTLLTGVLFEAIGWRPFVALGLGLSFSATVIIGVYWVRVARQNHSTQA